MSADEQASFERQLKENAALRDALELSTAVNDFLGDTELQDFRKKVEAAATRSARTTQTANTGRTGWLRIAAAIAALVVITAAVFFFLQGPSADHDQLFVAYFEPYPAHVKQRGPEEQHPSSFEQGLNAYTEADYEASIVLFRQSLDTSENTPVRFYLGIALLAVGNGEEAETQLYQVTRSDGNLFRSQAHWYMALALLQQGETGKTLAVLEEMEQMPGTYKQDEVLQLLDVLK